jgi:hypothetical protein
MPSRSKRLPTLAIIPVLLVACAKDSAPGDGRPSLAPESVSGTPPPPPDTARTDSILALATLGQDADSLWLANGVTLHTAPDSRAALITTVTRLDEVEQRELSYEEPAIVVRGSVPGWVRVALATGQRGWLAVPPTLRVVSLDSILPQSLSYLTPVWDRRIRSTPELAATTANAPGIDPDEDEIAVDIIEAVRNAGGLWWRVRVLDASPCESLDTPRAIAEGWIPAWHGGKLTAEWYSRGC